MFLESIRHCRRIVSSGVLMASLAAPAMAQPHSVQGVKADDVLNIREDIHHTRDVSGSPVVGTIPPDADDVMVTGVSVDIGGATWRAGAYNGAVGGANNHYLKPTSTILQAPEALTPLTVIVRHTEACTDGMSDLNFDYEAILLGLSPDGAPAYGCCSMTP